VTEEVRPGGGRIWRHARRRAAMREAGGKGVRRLPVFKRRAASGYAARRSLSFTSEMPEVCSPVSAGVDSDR